MVWLIEWQVVKWIWIFIALLYAASFRGCKVIKKGRPHCNGKLLYLTLAAVISVCAPC